MTALLVILLFAVCFACYGIGWADGAASARWRRERSAEAEYLDMTDRAGA